MNTVTGNLRKQRSRLGYLTRVKTPASGGSHAAVLASAQRLAMAISRWQGIVSAPVLRDNVLYVTEVHGRSMPWMPTAAAPGGPASFPTGFTPPPRFPKTLCSLAATAARCIAWPAKRAKRFGRPTTGGEVWSSPVVRDETVFFGSADGRFYALDQNTGKPRWTQTLGRTDLCLCLRCRETYLFRLRRRQSLCPGSSVRKTSLEHADWRWHRFHTGCGWRHGSGGFRGLFLLCARCRHWSHALEI